MGLFDRILRKSKQRVREKIVKRKKKQQVQLPKLDIDKEKLQDWSELIAKVRSHPLSQAGIINTEVLMRLVQSLESIDYKLSDLKKLDDILLLLKKSKDELEQKGVSSTTLDTAVQELERISMGDKTALDAIKKYGPVTTEKLADKMKLSRSTMSTKLNKLYTLGMLDKQVVGKEVQFFFKNQ